MARLERPTTESSNPAQRFLEWKSNDKNFSYYDKASGQNISVDLPLKFLFLEHYHTVKGWSDSAGSGIWANEVFLTGTEELTVKSKAGVIAKGLYKDIKTQVNNAGGNYYRSIYVMLEDGSIVNIALKGAAIGGIKKEKSASKKDEPGYSDFYKANQNQTDYHWIECNGVAEGKSGSVKYSIPVFTIGEKISDDENALANAAAKELQDHMTAYMATEPTRKHSEVNKYEEATATASTEDLDDLDF